MRRYLLFLIFVLTFCFASEAMGAEARKLALLVGVDEYVKVPSLKCCVNDMKTLKEALKKIGFEDSDIQMLVTGRDQNFEDLPTKANIEQRISDLLSKAQPKDIVFIALSGHGAQEGKNVYFCPPDVKVDNLEGTCVSINKIMDDLAKCNAKFKWLVVDACRNDPNQNAKGIGGKGLRVIPTPPPGIALFQSCAEGEESWEDRETGNGFFTKNFAAALSGEADSDHDGKLTLMEVCKWTTAKTTEQVNSSHKKTQRPYFSGSVSDFTLIENQDFLKAKELATAARAAMEAEDYDLAVEKYDAALAIYPNHVQWKSDRDLAQRLRDSKPKFNPMKIVVPDDFETIEDAYTNIKDGGTITIQPGKYELSKTLVINRPVTFRGSTGQPEDIVIDCPSTNAFEITGGSPSFQNLTASSGEEESGGFYVTGGTPKLFRCIVTSRKGAGMYVEGENANPQVESCTLKNCAGSGVSVYEKGLGTFSDCKIYGNALAGISVGESGKPTVTGCKIHDNKEVGIEIYDNGLGSFSDCEIYGNVDSGIEVSESGNPTVTGCKIHDSKEGGGVYVYDKGLGTFKDCEIYGNVYSEIEVCESGNPTVTGCKIHDGKAQGIGVYQSGLGTFTDCEIYENSVSGIAIGSSGNPTITGCIIHDNKEVGVRVFDNGHGKFSDCEIYGNAKSGISVILSGNPEVNRCRIHDEIVGVAVGNEGHGSFNNCEIYRTKMVGFSATRSGNPTVTGCKIHDVTGGGIFVSEKGLGSFRGCEIYRYSVVGIDVATSGNPTVTGCIIHDGLCGIWIRNKGMGTFNNNTLERNYLNSEPYNWYIKSDAGDVKGYGNTPAIPAKGTGN